jgi:hypothetical protein
VVPSTTAAALWARPYWVSHASSASVKAARMAVSSGTDWLVWFMRCELASVSRLCKILNKCGDVAEGKKY